MAHHSEKNRIQKSNRIVDRRYDWNDAQSWKVQKTKENKLIFYITILKKKIVYKRNSLMMWVGAVSTAGGQTDQLSTRGRRGRAA